MHTIDREIIQKLNEIAQASEVERAQLIEQFLAEHPDHKQWVKAFTENENKEFPSTELPQIAHYQLLKSIGSGANGQVYQALDEAQNTVAIKVPNAWLSTEQIQRFKHEAELLQRLDHPSIAKIIGVGETKLQGQTMPFIVMEYVDGSDIKNHCQQANLTLQQRVQLIIQVLDAIQHAHQNRVIHRDLKPDNIIVDSKGVPKVIDFGIATLSNDATRALTQLTRTGEVVGTLSYMSPEQVSGSDALDSRSDIYSCGVVLYELLAEQLPHKINPAQFFSAISAIIEEPIKPITQQSVSIDDSLAAVVHHALEKNPDKRFQSANEFSRDLNRWLNNEPVESQALSKFYWVKQAIKKNKALVTGTVLAFAGLVLGLLFAISFAVKEQAARTLAETKAESNRKVVEFINDLFVNADPGRALGETITVKQVVSGAEFAVEKNLSESPEVEAQIRLILGNVNHALERYDVALAHYDKGLSLVNEQDDLYPQLVTQKINVLGATTKFDQQNTLIEHARTTLDSQGDKDFLDRINIDQAANYSVNNRTEEAVTILKALEADSTVTAQNLVATRKQLGRIYRELGQFQESHDVFADLVEQGISMYGATHPVTIDLRQELALSLRYLNQLDEAIEIYLGVVKDAQKAFTDDSLTTLLVRVNLAVAYMYQGNFEQAELETAEVLPKMIEQLGSLHQYTMSTRNIRAGALDNLDRVDEAIELYKDTLAAFAASENQDNPSVLTIQHNMAIAYTKKDDYPKAAEIYNDLLPKCFAQMGEKFHHCLIFANSMAEVEMTLGNFEAAQYWLDYSTPGLIETFGAEHPRVKAAERRQQQLNEKKADSN